MLNEIAKSIFILSVSGTMIAFVLLLIKPFIQNRVGNGWYYYMWLIVLVRLVVPFGVPLHVIGDVMGSGNNTTVQATAPMEMEAIDAVDNASQTQTQIETPMAENMETSRESNGVETMETSRETNVIESMQNYVFSYIPTQLPFLGLGWLGVSIFLFGKKLLLYGRFASQVKSGAQPLADEVVLAVYIDTCQSQGVKPIPIFTHPSIDSPLLMGLIHPQIILPEKQTKQKAQFKYIFIHELTHYQRLDIWYKWWMQLVRCIHWFNPMVYVIDKEVHRACELSCDEAVIQQLSSQEQRAYGDTLLHALELWGNSCNGAVSLTLAENTKLMKERLGAIMKFRKKTKLAVVVSVLLTFVLCTGAVFTGAQAATQSNGKNKIAANTINTTSVVEGNLQKVQPVPNTSIGARAYNGKWASATGIEGRTYKEQLDKKMKWIEDLYNEKKERFMLNETISQEEITNTLGIQYLYENSAVYRDMANVNGIMQSEPAVNMGGSFQFLPYDSTFSRTGNKKYFERSVFYVSQTAVMNLNVSYDLSEGKLGFMVISPDGKVVCTLEALSHCNNTISFSVEKGLWSFITINESETGIINGTQKIEGTITTAENVVVSSPKQMEPTNKNEGNTTANKTYTQEQADKRAIEIMTQSGTWGQELDSLIPSMTPDAINKVVTIYLERHLFPGITTPEGTKQVAATIHQALQYMTVEDRKKVERILSAYVE